MSKFCKDCKWVKISLIDRLMFGYKFAECSHPSSVKEPDNSDYPVTGKLRDATIYLCSTMRHDYTSAACGPSARYFEAK